MDLDYGDEADFDAAARGLLGTLEPCVITNDRGRVVWDAGQWDFLAEAGPPDGVHPSLSRIGRLNAMHGLFEVVPGVYQVRGLDISNMTIAEGDTGIVVIDPLACTETGRAALDLYRRHRGARPVRAVIYTHSHVDHYGGVLGITTPEQVSAGRVAVIAPDGFLEHAVGENVVAGPAMLRRAVYMYGATLRPGPRGQAGIGLGQAVSSGRPGLIPPTLTITKTGEERDCDGIRLIFQLTPDTEAPSEMNLYLPGHEVLLVAENATHTLHNLLTLRGAQVRDAKAWAGYLTEAMSLFAEAGVLIGSHHWPTWGRAEVARALTLQRDAYAYLHDQTVRLMNRGLTGAEIAEELAEFPGELGAAWALRGYYGSVSHNVKAVYQRYMGWYDGNPAHLWPHPPAEVASRYVAAMGGADAVVAMAARAAEQGDLRWAAELLNHVIFAEPRHARARELQALTFERLGLAQENGTWRNIYLTGAQELRGAAPVPRPARQVGHADVLSALTTAQLFHALAVRLDGPRAAGRRLLLRWEFTDPAETWTVLVGNGVLTPMSGDAPGGEPPQLTLRVRRADFVSVLAAVNTFTDLAASGAMQLTGDAAALTALTDLLEAPDRNFAIAEP